MADQFNKSLTLVKIISGQHLIFNTFARNEI